ncbi:MAG TPA: gliding motility-associated C-terminal domain-containing protein, partial [Mucilaginibacter sp.]
PSHNYTISYTDGLLMVMPLSNASLDNLSASAGPFTPPFDQTISNYVIDVPYSVDHTTVTPVMGDRTATIKVNDKQVSNGAASQNIQLSVGTNVVEIVVIAQDDVTKRTYTITINRAPAPVINASGILPPQSTVYGNASSIASFTVSGLNMIGGILVTAPKGYELSLDKDSFSKTLTIGSAGVIEPTLVYERLASTAVVGTYQGDIKLSAAEANNAIMPTGEGTVTPAHLQIIADNKTKGTGMANPPLTVTYSGFVNNDGPASLVTAPTITTTVNSMSAPGTYPIIASAASSPNYQITYGDGILTVASLNIPNSFTPNSDGINDTWKIKNIEDYQNFTVEIYNRYGARVYYSVNYPSPWDGRMKGSDTPAGTYYYIIRLGGENRPLSGYLTVIR